MLDSELRGVWITNIDSDVFFSQSAIANALDELAQLNFNTLYPTVWQGGFTLYESKVAEKCFGEKQDPKLKKAGINPLSEMIKYNKEKQYNFAIIPWFEFGLMAPANFALDKMHPDLFSQDKNKNRVRCSDKEARVWLNPLNEDVQKFIKELLIEIITEHDVDGIQLDDHFGMPVEFGYDDVTVELYQKDHSGKLPPTDHEDLRWMCWRADKITAFMKILFEAIKKAKPDCLVSLSPNPKAHSFEKYLQRWTDWERAGYIEELVLQVYRPDMTSFNKEIDKNEVLVDARKHIPTAIGIMTGTKREPNFSIDLIKQQIEESRRRHYAGVSFFFYESLWKQFVSESENERKKLFEEKFPTPASHPSLSDGWLPTT